VWASAAIVTTTLVLFNIHFYKHWDAPDAYPPEYLPPGANVSLVHTSIFNDEQLNSASIDRASATEVIAIESKMPDSIVYRCALSQARTVHFPRLFWPEWKLYVNGKELPALNDGKGFQSAVLPAGQYTLNMILATPAAEIIARIVSAFSIVLLMVVGVSRFLRRRRRTASRMVEYVDTTLALHHETTAAL
jgi:hypothetical protein